ncbi:hypothetical protein [Rhodococcoides corynebacterioides]|uniref:hypothetical protein n=1 Tax=Rhodococcoides corynebacterioides TaxID=53972 RepID=UPI001C9B3722|nr:hypothetical protein [Rhodococcus corynebacterioides]MBY6352039.1 hypothetical protein [Rhodococcus corynebacterioides]
MRHVDAIHITETVLRDLIQEVIGDDWKIQPQIDVAGLEKKRRSDIQKRPELIGTPPLIKYLEFSQLQKIIANEWPRFEPAVGPQDHFDLDMARLHAYRNPSMHSRELLEHEEHLVHGLTGRMRVQITKYRSEQGPDMNYYPRIERIEDTTHGVTLSSGHRSTAILRPGDKLTFRCSATDPQGRTLTWALKILESDNSWPTVDEATGDNVELVWNVTTSNVREEASATFFLQSDGEYHRHGPHDDDRIVFYSVKPPLA